MSVNKKILSLRHAVVSALDTKFPELKTCKSFPGRYSIETLKSEVSQAPSMNVAILGVSSPVGTREVDAEVSLAVYILALDEVALALVEGAMSLVWENQWGLEGTHPAKKLSAENLFFSEVETKKVALWALTWTQKLGIGKDIFSEDGTKLKTIYASHDPKIGKLHKDDYKRIADAP